MSANGVFSGILEYDFIGGGNLIIAANTYVVFDFSLASQFEAVDVQQPEGNFSSTLEYSISSTGGVAISADASSEVQMVLNSDGGVSISGTASGNFPGPTLSATGGYKPIEGQALLTFGFSSDSFVEFGVTIRGSATGRISFEANAEAFLPITGTVNYPYDFNLSSVATQFSLGTASGSYGFEFSSSGLNLSTHTYNLLGKNGVNFVNGIEHNDVTILTKQTDVIILNGAKTYAEII